MLFKVFCKFLVFCFYFAHFIVLYTHNQNHKNELKSADNYIFILKKSLSELLKIFIIIHFKVKKLTQYFNKSIKFDILLRMLIVLGNDSYFNQEIIKFLNARLRVNFVV